MSDLERACGVSVLLQVTSSCYSCCLEGHEDSVSR